MLNPCPKCSSTDGVTVRIHFNSVGEMYFEDESIYEVHAQNGFLMFKESKVVRCAKCSKIRRDLECHGRRIVKVS